MPQSSKSSASSATRKKHARKAAGPTPDAPPLVQKPKPSKKEIKKGLVPHPKKSYIAPSKLKPTPAQVDPLDSLGLAVLLPADLVVVLRRLAKKDSVTKIRALEELGEWVSKAREGDKEIRIISGEADTPLGVLVTALPVWLYWYPALSVHSSRRIRHLSAILHMSLFDMQTLRTALLTFLEETGSETQVSQVLGTWCFSAWDVDRNIAAIGSKSWKNIVIIGSRDSEPVLDSKDKRLILDDTILAQSVLPFVLTTAVDPPSVYTTLNPLHSTTSEDFSGPLGTRQGTSPPVLAPSSSGERGGRSIETLPAILSRGEEDPESTEDRNARLRVGALGVLKWIFDTYPPTEPLVSPLRLLLSSPQFWSILHHAAHPHFLSYTEAGVIEGLGCGQIIVRRAGWNIVRVLFGDSRTTWRDCLFTSSAGLISSAVLRSAFVEPDPVVRSAMWEPLLMFLTRFEDAWMLNFRYEHAKATIANAEDRRTDLSPSEDEMIPNNPSGESIVELTSPFKSVAYAEFLAFLTLGCNGSPIHGYPTVLVTLSTIPTEILRLNLASHLEFFDALWAAVDGRALSTLATERERNTNAFLCTWGECLLWTTGKFMKKGNVPLNPCSTIQEDGNLHETDLNRNTSTSSARVLVDVQFGRLAEELGQGLRVDASVTGKRVAAVIGKLDVLAPDLSEQAWLRVSRFVTVTVAGEENTVQGEYALSFLAVLHQHLPHKCSSTKKVESLVIAIATENVMRLKPTLSWPEEYVGREHISLVNGRVLEKLLEIFGPLLEKSEEFVKSIDELFTVNLTHTILQPSLVLSYLTRRSDSAQKAKVWRLLLSTLGSSTGTELDTRLAVLDVFLDYPKLVGPVSWAKPQEGELNELAKCLLCQALQGEPVMLNLTEKLLRVSDAFLDDLATEHVVSTILNTIRSHIQALIRGLSAPLTTLRSSLKLLSTLEKERATLLHAFSALDVMPWIFLLAFVLPQCSPNQEELSVIDLTKSVWDIWGENANHEAHKTVYDKIKDTLSALVLDVDVRPKPAILLHALRHANLRVGPLVFSDILPKQSELDSLLSSTSTDPIDRTLSITQPLMPPSCSARATDKSLWNRSFDASGFSPYARGVGCLLHVMELDRQFARENMWALRHALILALFAIEMLQVPGATSPVFGSNPKAAESELKHISQQTEQLVAFLLIPPDEEIWHKEVVSMLAANSSRTGALDSIGAFIKLVFEASMANETIRDSLILHTTLQHVLQSATKSDADLWIDLARSLEEKALQTSLAILLAVTEFAPEPPKLGRYRNELASRVTSVPATKANTAGLRLLRCLSAVAPNPDSDVIFLPQQRAVYLVQSLQAWMASDEDLDENVETEITLMLYHLAPIVQNVQGSHWEFAIDMIESNIENSSLKDGATVVLLFRSLQLLSTIQDLSLSNKYLRELWSERRKTVLVLVRNILAVKTDTILPSKPLAMCRAQALSIIQDLPGSLMDETTLSTMCHLITDPSLEVQKMAHQLLQKAAVTRTEHLAIEAGVDIDATIELPPELVALLQNNVNFEVSIVGVDASHVDSLGYLLGWMLLFDLFTEASLKVKVAYVDSMRKLDLIEGYFLPNIFQILGIGTESQKPFRLDAWSVEEYWVTYYDYTTQSLRLLAAHLYYRALLVVPSLIRTWWDELKDRQLLITVTAFTSSHFSPVLIKSELLHIKPSSSNLGNGEDSLTDESFSVKVAHAIHEVTATFNVDDQRMEVGVRLPIEYPLRAVEVRDIRRVGVPEKLWRKWLFAVQQVVNSQNGHIIDALSLFKKNVSLHFEGQVECAICYSIISVADRSLPMKPCKTCKNRFHSGCLYKWFNTSHSSSCPLCRSDIM